MALILQDFQWLETPLFVERGWHYEIQSDQLGCNHTDVSARLIKPRPPGISPGHNQNNFITLAAMDSCGNFRSA